MICVSIAFCASDRSRPAEEDPDDPKPDFDPSDVPVDKPDPAPDPPPVASPEPEPAPELEREPLAPRALLADP